MSEFNKGWWNCFCSFANEIMLSDKCEDNEIIAVLDGAGVTSEEINEAMLQLPFENSVVKILKEYETN